LAIAIVKSKLTRALRDLHAELLVGALLAPQALPGLEEALVVLGSREAKEANGIISELEKAGLIRLVYDTGSNSAV